MPRAPHTEFSDDKPYASYNKRMETSVIERIKAEKERGDKYHRKLSSVTSAPIRRVSGPFFFLHTCPSFYIYIAVRKYVSFLYPYMKVDTPYVYNLENAALDNQWFVCFDENVFTVRIYFTTVMNWIVMGIISFGKIYRVVLKLYTGRNPAFQLIFMLARSQWGWIKNLWGRLIALWGLFERNILLYCLLFDFHCKFGRANEHAKYIWLIKVGNWMRIRIFMYYAILNYISVKRKKKIFRSIDRREELRWNDKELVAWNEVSCGALVFQIG